MKYLTVYVILKTVRLGSLADGVYTSVHSVHLDRKTAEKELDKLLEDGMLNAHIVSKRVIR